MNSILRSSLDGCWRCDAKVDCVRIQGAGTVGSAAVALARHPASLFSSMGTSCHVYPFLVTRPLLSAGQYWAVLG